MNGAIVFTWKGTARGREAKGFEVFGNAIEYYERLTKDGRIQGHWEYVSLTGGGGGMLIAAGGMDDLLALLTEDEFIAMNVQASAVADDLQMQVMVGGDAETIQQVSGGAVETLQGIGLFA